MVPPLGSGTFGEIKNSSKKSKGQLDAYQKARSHETIDKAPRVRYYRERRNPKKS